MANCDMETLICIVHIHEEFKPDEILNSQDAGNVFKNDIQADAQRYHGCIV